MVINHNITFRITLKTFSGRSFYAWVLLNYDITHRYPVVYQNYVLHIQTLAYFGYRGFMSTNVRNNVVAWVSRELGTYIALAPPPPFLPNSIAPHPPSTAFDSKIFRIYKQVKNIRRKYICSQVKRGVFIFFPSRLHNSIHALQFSAYSITKCMVIRF